MASPRPVPSCLVVKNGMNRLFKVSAEMAYARVVNTELHQRALSFGPRGALGGGDLKLAAFRHGLHGVAQEVEHDLPQLVAV
jgi:hypothetical protein